MNALWQAGATVIAFDPVTIQEAQRIYANDQNLQLGDDKYSVLNDFDALLIYSEWQQLRAPNFDGKALRLNNKFIIDGCKLYSSERLKRATGLNTRLLAVDLNSLLHHKLETE